MLSRLSISLAQLKAGNNSEKHRKEIRQLLYSLYRSKNLTKQIYMPELESGESTEERGQGLEILTQNQILSGLPISLAQLKAGNNSEILRNEIRQLLYSLYRSKKLTRQIYKSLVDIT